MKSCSPALIEREASETSEIRKRFRGWCWNKTAQVLEQFKTDLACVVGPPAGPLSWNLNWTSRCLARRMAVPKIVPRLRRESSQTVSDRGARESPVLARKISRIANGNTQSQITRRQLSRRRSRVRASSAPPIFSDSSGFHLTKSSVSAFRSVVGDVYGCGLLFFHPLQKSLTSNKPICVPGFAPPVPKHGFSGPNLP